jgi:hypothetical protein
MEKYKNILNCHIKNTKIETIIIVPVALYGCKTWPNIL